MVLFDVFEFTCLHFFCIHVLQDRRTKGGAKEEGREKERRTQRKTKEGGRKEAQEEKENKTIKIICTGCLCCVHFLYSFFLYLFSLF